MSKTCRHNPHRCTPKFGYATTTRSWCKTRKAQDFYLNNNEHVDLEEKRVQADMRRKEYDERRRSRGPPMN